jgi:DNA-damage-inducible protein D
MATETINVSMMEHELSKQHITLFESIKELDGQGNEFWGAGKLSKVLEYSEFRHFLPVIERAKEACVNSGHPVADHFEDYLEDKEPKSLKTPKKK